MRRVMMGSDFAFSNNHQTPGTNATNCVPKRFRIDQSHTDLHPMGRPLLCWSLAPPATLSRPPPPSPRRLARVFLLASTPLSLLQKYAVTESSYVSTLLRAAQSLAPCPTQTCQPATQQLSQLPSCHQQSAAGQQHLMQQQHHQDLQLKLLLVPHSSSPLVPSQLLLGWMMMQQERCLL